MPQHKSRAVYQAILRLYPKAHRMEYGEQMLQVFSDMLADQQTTTERLSVWLRIGLELPKNITEEHVHNIRGMHMNTTKLTVKNVLLAIGGVCFIVGAIVLFMASQPNTYEPTTRAKVPTSNPLVACIQGAKNAVSITNTTEKTAIDNIVATSIIDIPAGTSVDAYVKSYDSGTIRGTAVYSGKYGKYNFTAKKTKDNTSNAYMGGWKITDFEKCN